MESSSEKSRYGIILGAFALIAVAFAVGWKTTHDLTWPNEHDLYREMASARSFLLEGFGHDPAYLGETIWYNPLTHLAMAAAQIISGLPLPTVAARCGLYLNLLGPLAFFAMASRLLGRWPALLALAGYLFSVGGAFPSWAAATYSPWLYPVNFAQGFFYLLILRLALLRNQRYDARWALLTGLLWGLTFLAHTAPMLIFACVLAGLLLAPEGLGGAHIRAWRSWWVPSLILVAAAGMVVLPFAQSVVGHYGLHIRNPIPNGYTPDFMGYRSIPLMLARHLQPPVLVGCFGLYLVIRGRCDPFVRRLLLIWMTVTGLAVFYGYLFIGLLKLGVHIPMVVPAFHFLFYFKAGLAVLFGLGAAELATRFARWLAARRPLHIEAWALRFGLTLALGLAFWNESAYLHRYDFQKARSEALGHATERDRIAVYEWTLRHATPDDVFLASDDLSLFAIAPAGAKVVAVDPYLSNPYVDIVTRRRDRNRMLDLLARGDSTAFADLARSYRVTHAVDEAAGTEHAFPPGHPLLHEEFSSGPLRVYRVGQIGEPLPLPDRSG